MSSSEDMSEDLFCIKQCATWILNGCFKKVALQLPDDLLSYAHLVSKSIEGEIGIKVYILGDTTFGSCCTDEVASEHIGADSIIHFGRTCLSPSQNLPVLYVLGPPVMLNSNEVLKRLEEFHIRLDEKLILTYDTLCCYSLDVLVSSLKKKFSNICVTKLITTGNSSIVLPLSKSNSDNLNEINLISNNCCSKESVVRFFGREVCLPEGDDIKEYNFIHIGPEDPCFTALQLRFSEKTFYHIPPDCNNCSSTISTKCVTMRSSKIEQLKNASIIGILIGTLGVSNHRDIVLRLKKLVKAAGKRSYTFVIGKPNEPKLANLDIVDVFIYVACPESSLFSRTDDPYLYRKLTTPWEAHIALDKRTDWNLNFELDFRQFLEGGYLHNEIVFEPEEEQGLPHIDSMQIAVKQTSQLSQNEAGTLSLLHEGGAGSQLMNLSWKGLEQTVEGPEPGVVFEGKKGIASSYEHEAPNT